MSEYYTTYSAAPYSTYSTSTVMNVAPSRVANATSSLSRTSAMHTADVRKSSDRDNIPMVTRIRPLKKRHVPLIPVPKQQTLRVLHPTVPSSNASQVSRNSSVCSSTRGGMRPSASPSVHETFVSHPNYGASTGVGVMNCQYDVEQRHEELHLQKVNDILAYECEYLAKQVALTNATLSEETDTAKQIASDINTTTQTMIRLREENSQLKKMIEERRQYKLLKTMNDTSISSIKSADIESPNKPIPRENSRPDSPRPEVLLSSELPAGKKSPNYGPIKEESTRTPIRETSGINSQDVSPDNSQVVIGNLPLIPESEELERSPSARSVTKPMTDVEIAQAQKFALESLRDSDSDDSSDEQDGEEIVESNLNRSMTSLQSEHVVEMIPIPTDDDLVEFKRQASIISDKQHDSSLDSICEMIKDEEAGSTFNPRHENSLVKAAGGDMDDLEDELAVGLPSTTHQQHYQPNAGIATFEEQLSQFHEAQALEQNALNELEQNLAMLQNEIEREKPKKKLGFFQRLCGGGLSKSAGVPDEPPQYDEFGRRIKSNSTTQSKSTAKSKSRSSESMNISVISRASPSPPRQYQYDEFGRRIKSNSTTNDQSYVDEEYQLQLAEQQRQYDLQMQAHAYETGEQLDQSHVDQSYMDQQSQLEQSYQHVDQSYHETSYVQPDGNQDAPSYVAQDEIHDQQQYDEMYQQQFLLQQQQEQEQQEQLQLDQQHYETGQQQYDTVTQQQYEQPIEHEHQLEHQHEQAERIQQQEPQYTQEEILQWQYEQQLMASQQLQQQENGGGGQYLEEPSWSAADTSQLDDSYMSHEQPAYNQLTTGELI